VNKSRGIVGLIGYEWDTKHEEDNVAALRMLMRQLRERLWGWFIWHLPRAMIYRSAIRLIAAATTGKYSDVSVPELTAMDAVKAWEA
jgi:hypothetical protein